MKTTNQHAIQLAEKHRDTPDEATIFIQSLYDNLSKSKQVVSVEAIQQTVSNFFSNPDNELEDYGLLADLVLEQNQSNSNVVEKKKNTVLKENITT